MKQRILPTREPVLDAVTCLNTNLWINQHTVYDRSGPLRLSFDRGVDTLYILKLENAQRRGTSCTRYSLDTVAPHVVHDLLLRAGSAAELVARLDALAWTAGRHGSYQAMHTNVDGVSAEVRRSDENPMRTFSPFCPERWKPLPDIPGKWTIPHVCRALINGQFRDLKCHGQYTDDYAGDAARNFGKGPIADGVAFARRIIESPSGWWISTDGESVRICCHHFDSNSFRFRLLPEKTTPAAA